MANRDAGDLNIRSTAGRDLGDWAAEETWWRDNYAERPYASADRGFDYYRPAYRYGFESASRYQGRGFDDVEPELRSGWDRYEHRGENKSAWEEIKEAVRDGWDRLTGKGRHA